MSLTKKDVALFNEQFQRVIDANQTAIDHAINRLETKMDKKFDQVDKQFKQVHKQLIEINVELSDVNADARMTRSNLNEHERRILKLETAKAK